MQGINPKSRQLIFFVTLVLITLLAAPSSYASWSDRFGPPKIVSLEEILAKPSAWLGTPVRIPVRFAWISDLYVPYRTRFTRDQFINFSAWDVKTHIWEKKGFDDPHAFFYVERDNKELKSFFKMKTFDTVCLLGQVESLFGGKPFIRVVWFCRLPGRLNVENLKMLNISIDDFKQRKFDKAISGFQKIFESDPPDDIRVLMHKAMAKIYLYDKKQYEMAKEELLKARKINPREHEVHSLLVACLYCIKRGIIPVEPLPKVKYKKDTATKSIGEEPVKPEKIEKAPKPVGMEPPKAKTPSPEPEELLPEEKIGE